MNTLEERTIEERISAQKRAAVLLDAPRETAKRTVRRPANSAVVGRMPDDFLQTLLLTLLIAAATLILLFTRVAQQSVGTQGLSDMFSGWFTSQAVLDAADVSSANSNIRGATTGQAAPLETEATTDSDAAPASTETESEVDVSNADTPAGEVVDNIEPLSAAVEPAQVALPADEPEFALLVDNDFSPPAFPFISRDAYPFARDDRQDEDMWLMDFVPGQNVYRIRVFPGYVAWSTLGFELPVPYRMETASMTVMETPMGYAGLLARYHDDQNFYLFNVAGDGQSQLLVQVEGEWRTITPWTPTILVNSAGESNVLAVEDDGDSLRFYINDAPIHQVLDPMLAPGLVGLAGGTKVQVPSESNFKWIRIYGKP